MSKCPEVQTSKRSNGTFKRPSVQAPNSPSDQASKRPDGQTSKRLNVQEFKRPDRYLLLKKVPGICFALRLLLLTEIPGAAFTLCLLFILSY